MMSLLGIFIQDGAYGGVVGVPEPKRSLLVFPTPRPQLGVLRR